MVLASCPSSFQTGIHVTLNLCLLFFLSFNVEQKTNVCLQFLFSICLILIYLTARLLLQMLPDQSGLKGFREHSIDKLCLKFSVLRFPALASQISIQLIPGWDLVQYLRLYNTYANTIPMPIV